MRTDGEPDRRAHRAVDDHHDDVPPGGASAAGLGGVRRRARRPPARRAVTMPPRSPSPSTARSSIGRRSATACRRRLRAARRPDGDHHRADHRRRRRRADRAARGDRARRPLPDRQHLQGHHGHRRAAARRGRPDPARRARSARARRAGRGDDQRSGRRRRHRAPAALPHVGLRFVPADVLRRSGRLVPGGRPARSQRRSGRRPGDGVPLLQPQLLPARPARRAASPAGPTRRWSRTACSAPLGIEGMRLAGTFDRDPAEVDPRLVAAAQLHGGARRRRLVGRHAVGHRDDRRLPRPEHARLAPAVAADGRADAPAGASRAVPEPGPLVRPRADGLRRRLLRAHRHRREHPRDGRSTAPTASRGRCSSAASTRGSRATSGASSIGRWPMRASPSPESSTSPATTSGADMGPVRPCGSGALDPRPPEDPGGQRVPTPRGPG